MQYESNDARSASTKRLLSQVRLLIDLLEAKLGDLEMLAKTKGRDSTELQKELRAKVQACYTVRLGLMLGRFKETSDLRKLVHRAQLQIEHRKFEEQKALTPDEIARTDIEHLMLQLVRGE